MTNDHAGHAMHGSGMHPAGAAGAHSGSHGAHGGHNMSDPAMAKMMERDVKHRFIVALVLTIPVVVLAGHVPGVPMMVEPKLSHWLQFVLATPVVWWCGWMFHAGTVAAIRHRSLDMSVLITTGVLAAYVSSAYLTIIGYPEAYFEAAVMLVSFVLFGHWMEMKSRRGTSDALRALFDLTPPKARVKRGGAVIEIATAEVVVGDTLVVRPGEKIPVDGKLITGTTDVDEALITGESVPVSKRTGDIVIGGSINTSGAVEIEALRVGRDTVLAQIAELVDRAQKSKAPGQRIADRAAAILVVIAIGAGIITFIAWFIGADATFLRSLTFAISAVVIACPDALGLATPTAVAVGTGLGARHNILIKDAATLEGVSRIDTVVLDKTGTLTLGKPQVTDVVAADGVGGPELLGIAGSLSALSTHPLSQAIVRYVAALKDAPAVTASDVRNVPGMGVEGSIDGQTAQIGNAKLMSERGLDPTLFESAANRLTAAGSSLTYVARGQRLLGVLGIRDAVRPTSAEAIGALKRLGILPVLLSGDNRATAERIAAEVGIERVFAEVRPEEKAAYVRKLQDEGRNVAMVGDGVNDAPALAQADTGIAIGAGTDVAIQAARVVLMKSDPADIPRAIRLSQATVRKMRQNLAWASVYNLLAIPVAAGAFYARFGWSLRPEISALLMSLSSIIVALNAVSLRWTRI